MTEHSYDWSPGQRTNLVIGSMASVNNQPTDPQNHAICSYFLPESTEPFSMPVQHPGLQILNYDVRLEIFCQCETVCCLANAWGGERSEGGLSSKLPLKTRRWSKSPGWVSKGNRNSTLMEVLLHREQAGNAPDSGKCEFFRFEQKVTELWRCRLPPGNIWQSARSTVIKSGARGLKWP